jgi:hypothetical protein
MTRSPTEKRRSSLVGISLRLMWPVVWRSRWVSHPPGQPDAYVRNGALGAIVALNPGAHPSDDTITVAFDGIGTIDLPRNYWAFHQRVRAWR